MPGRSDEAKVRLCALYLDRADGASWDALAKQYKFVSPVAARACLRRFSTECSLPWPVLSRCSAQTEDMGNPTRCMRGQGHEGNHDDGCVTWLPVLPVDEADERLIDDFMATQRTKRVSTPIDSPSAEALEAPIAVD